MPARPALALRRAALRSYRRSGRRQRSAAWAPALPAPAARPARRLPACGGPSATGMSRFRSFGPAPLDRRTPRQRLRVGAIALALHERPLDVVLGNERFDQ